jgi:hypothetical protein
MARRLTHAEALDSWRVHGELAGGHRPSETIAFVGALMDVDEEQQRALPPNVILAGDCEPKWVTRVRSWFGR